MLIIRHLASSRILRVCSWLAILSLAAGCGGGSKSTVSGTVKFRGSPLPNANIIFMNSQKTSFPGHTDEEGNYTITSIPTGEYRIFFQEPPAPPRGGGKGPVAGRAGSPGMGPPKGTDMPEMNRAYDLASKTGAKTVELPSEYYSYDTTKLTFQVKKSTETYPIDIP